MLNTKIFVVNPFGENAMVLWSTDDVASGGAGSHVGGEKPGAIVDPGCMGENEIMEVKEFIRKEGISPKMILLTHGHFDHIYGVPALAETYGVPVYMNPADEVMVQNNHQISRLYHLPDAPVGFKTVPALDGDEITLGDVTFKVIATPGHTPGGVCYYCESEKLLLSGDTLFAGAIGRTDHSWGDYDKLIVSIMEKLMALPGDVDVIPGHGPATSIATERTQNPFLQPFNEPDEDMPEDGIPISFE